MNRRITWGLALAGLLLAASVLTAASRNTAMSPAGTWTIQYVDDISEEANNTLLQQFHPRGTVSGAAWSDSKTNAMGVWRKTGRNRYIATVYVMIPEGNGYIRIIDEFWMVNKDEMEGRQEGWWVPGKDPLGPPAAPEPWWTGSQFYQRIPAEPKLFP